MIRKLFASNFRSLGEGVEIPLGQVNVLVGQNAAGKSSIIDLIRFLRDAVQQNAEQALSVRGGLPSIKRRGSAPNAALQVGAEYTFEGVKVSWKFSLIPEGEADFEVEYERYYATIPVQNGEWPIAHDWQRGIQLAVPKGTKPFNTGPRRLAAPACFEDDRPFRELRAACFYSLFPNELRPPQKPDPLRQPLNEHGTNWTSVLRRLKKATAGRDLIAALGRVVGDITDYRVNQVGGYLAVEFCHGGDTWLDTTQESDGTLRLAGLLTALLQDPAPPFICIEEPELTVHPGALPVLFDFIKEASQRSQIVISTHSPELLDLFDVDQLLVVERHGTTTVGPMDPAQRELVRKHLLSTSDLLRSEGLRQAAPTAAEG